jgi:hypothetical protein
VSDWIDRAPLEGWTPDAECSAATVARAAGRSVVAAADTASQIKN